MIVILSKGDKMYVRGSMSISNGSSDIAGGLATIKEIIVNKKLGEDHFNGIFVTFEELPGHSYNYRMLIEEQTELSKLYKGDTAHPDPDIDTPWIEEGDIVNGKVYKGNPIW